VAGIAADISEGYRQAKAVLEDGRAAAKVEALSKSGVSGEGKA